MIEAFGFNSLREVIAALLMLCGLVFFIGSAIGMLRLPDFYSRIHASGNSETLGCALSFIGLMIYEGATLTTVKMAFAFLIVFLANPIGSHILSKAAYKSGHPVWTLKSKGAKKLVGLEKPGHSADEPVGNLKKKEEK
ncbi:MAG: monovalent cation/H(+) antiporter subunit G [Phascolarctobacterium sp.]|uniref:monovalent cation/H(+) antiporter subunit G n=1 Tax=Phascolarctobacterium sp. TaxID=2049039 RepID=UPI0026DDA208|nr:monovalent cation/H(+) antiporter subunit G [Phascolarctobacterium sp.]MDO4921693.1 monovalent cation/H(+) antiporter subunit G [Phascolarctobacterium sp.]